MARTHEEAIEMANLQATVAHLSECVEKQAAATEQLVKLWEAAGTIVTVVKWGSSLVTALAIMWATFKHLPAPPTS